MIWSGVFTALVTPFTGEEHEISISKFDELVEHQIQANVDAIVVMGTTGESPTLSDEEGFSLIRRAVDVSAGHIKVIAGVSSNNTKSAVRKVQECKCEDLGVDGIMVTAPYYNKPNQEGLFRHYSQIAENTDLPILIYNVPGRTGVSISIETMQRLHKAFPHISGVKEASGDHNIITDTISAFRGTEFQVLVGDDGLTFSTMCLGGTGVVSVMSNILPEVMVSLVRFLEAGKLEQARELHMHYLPLMRMLLQTGNPMSIKSIMAHEGILEKTFRLPLYPMEETEEKALLDIYESVTKKASKSQVA